MRKLQAFGAKAMSVKYYCDYCCDEIEQIPIQLEVTKHFCDYSCLKLYAEEQEQREIE